MRVVAAVLALILACVHVKADLPIHCRLSDVVGTWDLALDAGNHDRAYTCGYPVPDANAFHFDAAFSDFELSVAETRKVRLDAPNVVKDAATGQPVGTWTMVYDEGLEVRIGSLRFFAFFQYTPKSKDNIESEEPSDFVSICTQTMIGWFREEGSDGTIARFGCFRGGQPRDIAAPANPAPANPAPDQTTTQPPVVSPVPLETTEGAAASLLQGRLRVGRGKQQHRQRRRQRHRRNAESLLSQQERVITRVAEADAEAVFAPDFDLVESINRDASSTWNAQVHPQFVGSRVRDMSRMLGAHRFRSLREGDHHQGKGTRTTHTTAHASSTHARTRNDDLPDAWDWRNVDGVNYDTPVKNQGGCGSCFTMAAMSVVEARVRIQTHNKQQPMLSSQDVVSCSVVNQGCDGGYPFLVGMHGHEYGFVEESCFPYTGMASSKCSEECANAPRYFVRDYCYVGGFYGGCSEAAMRREIFDHGPIVIAFDAPSSLFYYKGGVFTGDAPPHEAQSNIAATHGVHQWEKTNHAVVAVGWGVDAGTPYWIIKNTWGETWGEKGYFRIRRGVDECGIESMAVALDVDPTPRVASPKRWNPDANEPAEAVPDDSEALIDFGTN